MNEVNKRKSVKGNGKSRRRNSEQHHSISKRNEKKIHRNTNSTSLKDSGKNKSRRKTATKRKNGDNCKSESYGRSKYEVIDRILTKMLKYGLVILVAIYLSLLYLNRNGNLFTSDECDATTYEASTPNNAANSANADKGCHVGEGEVEEVIIR